MENIKYIKVSEIIPNKHQPRSEFALHELNELANSIKAHGIIQPIVVRRNEKNYEIIAGERRYRACLILKMDEVPVIVNDVSEEESAELAIIENIQRENLSAIEEAIAYKKLISLYNLTQEQVAISVGKKQSTIANKLRLLNLAPEVQQAVLKKEITERHARSLLTYSDFKKQNAFLEKIKKENLNVAQTEKEIKKEKSPKVMKKGISRQTKIAINTIEKAVDMIQKMGMDIQSNTIEVDEYVEITIKIKK